MGLFLQKTNIIRDYLEDLVDGRAFWPREIWGLYAPRLYDLRDYMVGTSADGAQLSSEEISARQEQAMACLNHMVANALTLMPSCLTYMGRLRNNDVFKFCAIPQLMAVATLEKVVNNPDVFTGVVKIRKGQALKLLTQGNTMQVRPRSLLRSFACAVSLSYPSFLLLPFPLQSVYATFLSHARSILNSIPPHHTRARAIASVAVAEVERICLANLPTGLGALATSAFFSPTAILFVSALTAYLLRHLYLRSKEGSWGDGTMTHLPRITDSWDVLALSVLVACVCYLIACGGVPLAMRAATSPSPPSSPRHIQSPAASASAGRKTAAPTPTDADDSDDASAAASATMAASAATPKSAKARRRVVE
jgi:hypothetical protein